MEEGEQRPAPATLRPARMFWCKGTGLRLCAVAPTFGRTEIPVEVVVVDTNSTDGSAAAGEEAVPQVKVHRMRKNVGFGRAANAGLEHTSGRFILVLNPDVMVSEGCLGELADFLLVRPDAGAVGPRILQPGGKLDESARRAFPTPSVAVYRAIGLSRLFPHSAKYGRYNMGHLSAERVHEIDSGTAACLLVRRTAIAKVGFFDPAYFMYFEDIDLCFRLKQGGWKIFYIPSAEALHVTGASSSQGQRRALYQLHSANWTFHHKHYADELPAFGNGLVWAAIWIRWAVLTGLSEVKNRTAKTAESGGSAAVP